MGNRKILTSETELVTAIEAIFMTVVKETYAYATTIGTSPVSVRIARFTASRARRKKREIDGMEDV